MHSMKQKPSNKEILTVANFSVYLCTWVTEVWRGEVYALVYQGLTSLFSCLIQIA